MASIEKKAPLGLPADVSKELDPIMPSICWKEKDAACDPGDLSSLAPDCSVLYYHIGLLGLNLLGEDTLYLSVICFTFHTFSVFLLSLVDWFALKLENFNISRAKTSANKKGHIVRRYLITQISSFKLDNNLFGSGKTFKRQI